MSLLFFNLESIKSTVFLLKPATISPKQSIFHLNTIPQQKTSNYQNK